VPKRFNVEASKRFALNKTGVISVNCLPKEPAWVGWQEWALIPTSHPQLGTIPFNDSFKDDAKVDEMTKFMTWINRVRSEQKRMPSTVLTEDLGPVAKDTLLSSDSIEHDRRQLGTFKKILIPKGLDLVGELRVHATSMHDAAKLLWWSPPHRDLLLNANAEKFWISEKAVDGKTKLYVIVGIKPLSVAQKPKGNSTKALQ
jgi:hypothetical protein